jgi:hypothetical protein
MTDEMITKMDEARRDRFALWMAFFFTLGFISGCAVCMAIVIVDRVMQ